MKKELGFITHKVTIRGPDQSEPTLKKMILNKSIDLLEKTLHKPNKILSFSELFSEFLAGSFFSEKD